MTCGETCPQCGGKCSGTYGHGTHTCGSCRNTWPNTTSEEEG